MIDEKRNARLCIHPHYDSRSDPISFDDRPMRDEWQDAVYAIARDIAVGRGYRSVVDYGCGSGFKLMKYFSGYETVGYELEPTLSFLNKTFPDRRWQDDDPYQFRCDMLICADVIEHMYDPVSLLKKIADSPLQLAIISTPSLEILSERGESPRLGPPDNRSHVNEWTTREFRDFVAMHLKVLYHAVVSVEQGTQMIVARPK